MLNNYLYFEYFFIMIEKTIELTDERTEEDASKLVIFYN
jgi:hypothetical protein